MRKLLWLFLVVVIATVGGSAALAQDNRTVITLWHIAVEADSFASIIPPSIEEFNATNTEYRIDAQAIQLDSFRTQLQIAASAGELPDAFMTWGGGNLKNFVDEGLVRPVEALTGEQGAAFLPSSLGPATFDGQPYAIPLNLSVVVLWVNKDLFEQYEVTIPATWDEFLTACEAFNSAGIVPLSMGNSASWPGGHFFSYLAMRLAGHEVVEQAIAREIPFTDPVFVRAGELIQEAVAANCFGQGFNGVTDLDAQIVMATGGAAMRTMGDWDYVGLEAANPDILNSLTVINFPSLAEGEGDPTEMIGGTGVAFAISASAPEGTDAALVELFSSDYFVERLLNVGFFPALIGYEDQIESPLKQEIQGLIGQSSYIQLFWDQLLPPALAERHVATTQGLLGMSMTPQEAADIMEQTAVEEIGPME